MNKYKIILKELDGGKKEAPQFIQVLRTGKFKHELFGEIDITSEMLQQMKKNFDDRSRGVDLALDYAHESDREAAGWIKSVKLENNDSELWAEIEWTPAGKQKVESQEFRYISADFSTNYINNESGKQYGCCLFGAGLTNRPFVKNMKPTTELKEAGKMDEKKMQELQDANTKLLAEKAALEAERKQLQDKLAAIELAAAKAAKETEFSTLLAEGKVVPAQKESFLKGDMAEFIKNAVKINLDEKGSSEQGTGENETKTADQEADEIQAAAKKLAEEKKIKLFDAYREVMRNKQGGK